MTLRPLSDRVFSALIVLAAALAMSASGGLARIDYVLYDLGQRLFTEAPPNDLVIVAIDEDSLAKLGRWPWSRRLHATLIDRLKRDGARVIGLDLIFSEPDTADQPADAALADAIRRAGNVVLPVLLESSRLNGQVLETLPLPQLLEHAAGLGRVHAELDADGIARSVFLWEGVGTPAWPHFAQAVLAAAHALPPGLRTVAPRVGDARPFALVRREQRRIRFMGPPGRVPSLSYVQVLTGEFPRGLFKNKIVLVGATAAGMGDLLPTPVSGLHRPMPGVEFHANVIESMRRGQLIRTAPLSWVLLAAAVAALMPLWWLPRSAPLPGLLASVAWLLFVAGIAICLPRWLDWWLPPSGALFAIAIAYPVWSWRRLETAGRFLDHELRRLRQDLHQIDGDSASAPIHAPRDPFQARIVQVQTAAARLRHLQAARDETLAFISHDIRAPLAGALQQLDSSERIDARLRASLARALALAEDFLASSRAEMADRSRFQELDLAAVLHQAADDAYAVLRANAQRLMRDIADEPVWIQGDFGLLHRAVLNLLLNAAKYAPRDSVVSLKLTCADAVAQIQVCDQGAGMPPAQAARLFQRFSRAGSATAAADSSGLGLYFVRTVAEKHGGSVAYAQRAGEGACFGMRIPVMADT